MLKCIPVSNLRLGMYIQDLGGSWLDHSFWKNSFLLDSEKDLQRLLNTASIKEVWIDTNKGLDVAVAKNLGMPPVAPVPEKKDEELIPIPELPSLPEPAPPPRAKPVLPQSTAPVSLEQEMEAAGQLRDQARAVVGSLFDDARAGHTLDTEEASALVEGITHSVLRNADALANLVRLKSADDYTYMHSVAVCVLMIKLALQLKLSDELVYEAGLAGLLHDIGKVSVPDEILNKPGKLTDEEFGIIQHHPVAGSEILRQNLHLSPHALDVCLHHHEKVDGSGYPHRLSSNNISLMARMGAVCDVYDAITSDRPYKKGWNPAESLHRMATWENHFDRSILQAFVKTMGIYPTGSLVRLQSDRLAIILEQNEGSLLAPRVKVFFCALRKCRLPHSILDLSDPDEEDRILCRESPEEWGFKELDTLWTGGV